RLDKKLGSITNILSIDHFFRLLKLLVFYCLRYCVKLREFFWWQCHKGSPFLVPKYCFNTHNASKKMTLEDGTELTPALGIGAFAEKTLVHEGQCTKVNPEEDPAAAGLLGCGIMA